MQQVRGLSPFLQQTTHSYTLALLRAADDVSVGRGFVVVFPVPYQSASSIDSKSPTIRPKRNYMFAATNTRQANKIRTI